MRRTELVAGDQIKIGPVTITLESKTGRRARVSISTNHGLPIRIISYADRNRSAEIRSIPVESDLKTA